MAQFGILGGGSWATALAKIITKKESHLNWWMRSKEMIDFILQNGHNPRYLTSVNFNTKLLNLGTNAQEIIHLSEFIILAIPSAYIENELNKLPVDIFKGKKIISAIKGIMPTENELLNFYLQKKFGVELENYFALLGPCHAEEVASDKLSYLTISGIDIHTASIIASQIANPFINTIVNHDILGVQYAAVLKNVYALGAGIAHGLNYGDNFLSVYISNAADEMAMFLKKTGAQHIEVGSEDVNNKTSTRKINYAASVYMGDLLVTCYSLYSRNRTLGAMIGKGYSVKAAQLEMNMVAEGYNASKCIFNIGQQLKIAMPIAESIYKILWQNLAPALGFTRIEKVLI